MQKIITRLKRVNGQISGIIKMLENYEDCEKTIIQFQAAKAALDRAFSENLNVNLQQCLKEKDPKSLKKILDLISKR